MSQAGKRGLVWGGLLIALGVLLLIQVYVDLTAWIWVAVLAAAGFGAFLIYLTDPSDWGMLIPAYVLWAVAGLVALIELDVLMDEWIALYVLSAIALPFLAGFLRDRKRWGLLIPAYVLLAVGLMVGLIGAGVLDDLLVPAYVMFAIAIPFLLVFVRNRANWWALIPGGIMAVIGLSFLIAESAIEYIFPVAVILVGVWILVRQFMAKEPLPAEEPVESTPEVDEFPR
jgi:hypothetical protein